MSEIILRIVSTQLLESFLSFLSISTVAGLVRAIFSPRPNFKETLITFIGCLLLGLLVGHCVNSVQGAHQYDIAAAAISSLFGRELIGGIMRAIQRFERNPFQTARDVMRIKLGKNPRDDD